jgi:hypothetical protein
MGADFESQTERSSDMTITDLIIPTVHLNGTSREELVRVRCDVFHALRDVEKALCQMSPNGRDYYVVPGSLRKAQAQHQRRMETIKSLMDELTAEAEAIQDQGK